MVGSLGLFIVALSFSGPSLPSQQAGVWLDVPFVRQQGNGCGAASLAMVLQYWQFQQHLTMEPAADPGEILRALYSRAAGGIYASDMERYLQRQGFRTFAFRGEWSDLREQLEKGRPLIVALKAERAQLHYVVVAGLDWQQDVVLKNDPAQRKLLKQERSEFEKEWKAAGNWTLLAVPREEERTPSR